MDYYRLFFGIVQMWGSGFSFFAARKAMNRDDKVIYWAFVVVNALGGCYNLVVGA